MGALAVIGASDRVNGADMTSGSMSSAAGGGDTFAPGNDVFLRVQTSGTGTTVTVGVAGTAAGPRGTFIAPVQLGAVAATADREFGPFPAAPFADPADGQVHVSYTSVTGVKVGVYRHPNT